MYIVPRTVEGRNEYRIFVGKRPLERPRGRIILRGILRKKVLRVRATWNWFVFSGGLLYQRC
jgi:hypothetical protein